MTDACHDLTIPRFLDRKLTAEEREQAWVEDGAPWRERHAQLRAQLDDEALS